MRWPELQRMAWIENRRAPFNRRHLMEKFGISMPQASKDINKFLRRNPGRWRYDGSKKHYVRV